MSCKFCWLPTGGEEPSAGYYAPTLPVSGWYLWRYVGLVRPQARLLLISLTIPSLARKIKRLRAELLADLDATLTACRRLTRYAAIGAH